MPSFCTLQFLILNATDTFWSVPNILIHALGQKGTFNEHFLFILTMLNAHVKHAVWLIAPLLAD